MQRSTLRLLRSLSVPAARRYVVPWLAWSILALGPSGVFAETPTEEGDDAAIEAPAPVGLRAYIDPETGELTSSPSPEQIEALSKDFAPSLNRSSVGLEPFELRTGGRGVFLRGRFLSALTVRRTDDGGFEMGCAADAEHPASDTEAVVAPDDHQSMALLQSAAQPPSSVQTQWVER